MKNNLDELRKLNGLTQEEFAKELRVSINDWYEKMILIDNFLFLK